MPTDASALNGADTGAITNVILKIYDVNNTSKVIDEKSNPWLTFQESQVPSRLIKNSKKEKKENCEPCLRIINLL